MGGGGGGGRAACKCREAPVTAQGNPCNSLTALLCDKRAQEATGARQRCQSRGRAGCAHDISQDMLVHHARPSRMIAGRTKHPKRCEMRAQHSTLCRPPFLHPNGAGQNRQSFPIAEKQAALGQQTSRSPRSSPPAHTYRLAASDYGLLCLDLSFRCVLEPAQHLNWPLGWSPLLRSPPAAPLQSPAHAAAGGLVAHPPRACCRLRRPPAGFHRRRRPRCVFPLQPLLAPSPAPSGPPSQPCQWQRR